MYGHGDDVGILRKTVRYLLNASHAISFEMVEIYDDKVLDCLKSIKTDAMSNTGNKASRIAIESLENFDSMLTAALQHRHQKATNQNETSSRSHAITKVILDGLPHGSLLFADLAGFESIDGKENRKETLFINQSLLELNKVLLDMQKNKVPVFTSALTKFFKPHFRDGDIVMLYHLQAQSSESMKSGLGYIKELTCKQPLSVKPNVNMKPASAAKKQQPNAKESRIAHYNRFRI